MRLEIKRGKKLIVAITYLIKVTRLPHFKPKERFLYNINEETLIGAEKNPLKTAANFCVIV